MRKCLIGLLFCVGLLNAQPAFDVASVRVVDTDLMAIKPTWTPGRFVWITNLWYLTSYAWNLPRPRVHLRVPGNASIYQVEATMSVSATQDQVRLMLRALLESRFKLVSHVASTEADGYALTIGKGGLKVKESPVDDTAKPPFVVPIQTSNVVLVTAHHIPMQQLAEMLQVTRREMVWDETGLTGNYDFKFRYAIGDDPEADAPALATALHENLGLDYKKHRGAVDSLIVDSIEKIPTEN